MPVAEQIDTITARELAAALEMEYSTIIRWIHAGKVHVTNPRKPGASRNPQWLIPRSEIERIRRGEPMGS